MSETAPHPVRSVILRGAVGLTAISLLVYVPYRYLTRAPELGGFLGTAYALLFPLSAVLAVAALLVAWRPGLLRSLGGTPAGTKARWILGLYGGAWVLMGLMCLPTLTSLAAHSPVESLFATVHMTAQHVFLGFSAVGVAVDPAVSRAILDGREAGSARGDGQAIHAAESPGGKS